MIASPQSKFASLFNSFCSATRPVYICAPSAAAIAKNGINPSMMIDIYQQYVKPITKATATEKEASRIGERLSVLTPLIRLVSCAIAAVRILAPFSLSSNQPMFFRRMLLYRIYLISKVTFSPRYPKQTLTIVAAIKAVRAINPIYPQYIETYCLKYSLPSIPEINSSYSKERGNIPNNLDNIKPVSGFGTPLIAENIKPMIMSILGLLKGKILLKFLIAFFSSTS